MECSVNPTPIGAICRGLVGTGGDMQSGLGIVLASAANGTCFVRLPQPGSVALQLRG